MTYCSQDFLRIPLLSAVLAAHWCRSSHLVRGRFPAGWRGNLRLPWWVVLVQMNGGVPEGVRVSGGVGKVRKSVVMRWLASYGFAMALKLSSMILVC